MCDVEWVFVAALRKFESPSYRYQNFSRFPAKNAKASAAGTGFAGSPFEVRTTNSRPVAHKTTPCLNLLRQTKDSHALLWMLHLGSIQ
jgi:hypothetical protein